VIRTEARRHGFAKKGNNLPNANQQVSDVHLMPFQQRDILASSAPTMMMILGQNNMVIIM